MEFVFDFAKTTISTNVGAFLEENLRTEKEKESLRTIIRGRKLQYGDANVLLSSIVQALTIINGGNSVEKVIVPSIRIKVYLRLSLLSNNIHSSQYESSKISVFHKNLFRLSLITPI